MIELLAIDAQLLIIDVQMELTNELILMTEQNLHETLLYKLIKLKRDILYIPCDMLEIFVKE